MNNSDVDEVNNINVINNNLPETAAAAASAALATSDSAAAAESKIEFFQTFEEDAAFYRFMSHCQPIFLERNVQLNEKKRKSQRRANFKLDNILQSKMQALDYINVALVCLQQKLSDTKQEPGTKVCVQVTAYKNSHKLLHKSMPLVFNPKQNIDTYANFSIPVRALATASDQSTVYKLRFCMQPIAQTTTYGSELVLYKQSTGFIAEGMYEAMLLPLDNCSNNNNLITTDMCAQKHMLKFYLKRSKLELPAVIAATELQAYVMSEEPSLTKPHDNNNNDDTQHVQIAYNFIVNNNTQKVTELTTQKICVWCARSFTNIHTLLRHLQRFHLRFSFECYKSANGYNIDVTSNEEYYNENSPLNLPYLRSNVPLQRSTACHLLVYRPRRTKLTTKPKVEPADAATSEANITHTSMGICYEQIDNAKSGIMDAAAFMPMLKEENTNENVLTKEGQEDAATSEENIKYYSTPPHLRAQWEQETL